MKKFLIIFIIIFYPLNLMAADYSKLPTIKNILFSTNEVHLSCFTKEGNFLGMLQYFDELKLVQFSGWKLEGVGINIEPSSTKQLIKFPIPDQLLELFTLDLNNFKMEIKQYDSIDWNDTSPDEALMKAIKDKTLFDYLKDEAPSKIEKIDCGVTWAFKIREIKKDKDVRRQLLDEAIKESKKKQCEGDHLKWNNCVGFRGSYLGEYNDGWMSGHGLVFEKFGNFYVGSFFEDYKEGEGTQYAGAWYESVTNYPEGKTAWVLKGLRIEDEWSDENDMEPYETKEKFSFF
ncbi:hypothetical protein N8741_03010 [Candidatus Pelagibacter sp.]|nr:hypothetical protein [Candidatus Pelagibacter sp.]|tara:strand:- start:1011 stop:1877 length:867 start_codon:yes stop_codon:yes gene_type:complete